jgi:hypothetical protein
VGLAMDRQPLLLFPALECPDVALEIAGDFFPRVQTIGGR